jgi:hypothetical protein
VIDPTGKMTADAGEFAGLDRFQARKRVVARLERPVSSSPSATTTTQWAIASAAGPSSSRSCRHSGS